MRHSNKHASRVRLQKSPWWNAFDCHPVIRKWQRTLLRKSRESRTAARVRIFELIGRLAEDPKIFAHIASCYLAVGETSLKPVAFHNYRPEERGTVDFEDMGIVAKAARERRTIYAADVSVNEDYKEISTATQSELTIPIVWERELLGVINLESRRKDGFGAEAEAKVRETLPELIMELLVLRSLASSENWCPWHPRIHGWDLHATLSELLAAAASEVPNCSCSFTIWYADWEKRILFAYATYGYDWEYTAKALPMDHSEIGRCMQANAPLVPVNVKAFLEHDKATSMGIKEGYLALVPPAGHDSVQPIAGLTCYFRRQDDYPDPLEGNDRLIAKSSLEGLAKLLSKFLLTYQKRRQAYAKAFLNAINAQSALGGRQTRFEEWLAGLQAVFSARAGSVFLLDQRGDVLQSVATTGYYDFRTSTRSFDLSKHMYHLKEDARSHTVGTFRMRGKALRIHLLANRDRVWDKQFEPQRHHAEFIAGEPLRRREESTRKILLCGISDEHRMMGVVRLVRGNDDRLFTKYEADSLERLCEGDWVPEAEHLERDKLPIESPEGNCTPF